MTQLLQVTTTISLPDMFWSLCRVVRSWSNVIVCPFNLECFLSEAGQSRRRADCQMFGMCCECE